MQPSLDSPRSVKQSWTYAALTVVDGARRLKPCEVSFDIICFTESPHLTSSQVEIIITNGDAENRRFATVLPHEADATEIPIELVKQ